MMKSQANCYNKNIYLLTEKIVLIIMQMTTKNEDDE